MDIFFYALRRRRLFVAVLSSIAALLGVVWVSTVHAQAESTTKVAGTHIINLHDGGQDIGFITKKTTLREALEAADIRLDPNDRTEPGLDTELIAPSYEINIYRARPVVIRDGQLELKVISSYRTGRQIVEQAGISLRDEDVVTASPSSDPLATGAAEIMTISRAVGFTFAFYGSTETAYTQAKTVEAMFAEKGITMHEADGTNVPLDTPITEGMTVKLWREGVQTVNRDEVVRFTTKTVEDADQPVGYKKVQTKGKDGRRTATYIIKTKNGIEVSKKEINSVVTEKPVQEIVIVGSKNSYSGSLKDWLYKLRMCETHGNYKTNTGNGYYGAYQFSAPTWNSLNTGYARADLAPSSVQDAAIIANTKRTAGLRTQNPGCYASTGISNYPPGS